MWADGAGAVGAVVAPADCEFDMAVKKLTMKELGVRSDRLCSWVVRWGNSKDGKVKCITCGKVIPVEEAHCSHYVGRACRTTRWDWRNIGPSCRYCNVYLNGNLARYTIYLQKKYGNDVVKELLHKEDLWKSGKAKAPSVRQMREIYNDALSKVRGIEKRLGMNIAPKSWKPEK